MSKNPILHSFRFAFQGLNLAMKERNFKLHLLSAIVVIILGFYCSVSRFEWCILLICIGGVVSLEILNTAIEKLVDLKSPGQHPLAGAVKDLAAAAVLFFSICSAIIGLTIFWPYFFY